ncbi:response regulator [Spirochaeta cellobiosiphila]|uniref:response regulator n=1 Tax=Spirochaeta cellobiosiphila TaxID=504483 RepID=UPI000405CFFC|nr:response regulator [Spirochaeta cellobiosiphila]
MEKEILIVEDEKIVALDIKNHLKRLGYNVADSFSRAEEAISFLETHPVNLVLMDIHLQGKMDGIEASEIIKDRWNYPVIMLTAFADENTISRSKKTEPFGYIIKPFHERELRTTIEMALYRHEMNQAIIERERLFSTTLESIADGVIVSDQNHNVSYVNQNAANLVTQETWLGKATNIVFPFLDNPSHEIIIKNNKEQTRRIIKTESELIDKNNVVGQVWALHDVTERRDLEDQLRQSQKMDALGRLASGVAHDFNNILTVIMGYCTLLLDGDDNQSVNEEIKGIQSASKKAVNLTRQLLLFSRQEKAEKEILKISTLVLGMEKMLSRLITEDISIRISADDGSYYIWADPGQIEQVLINIVVNARDALPSGGLIHIKTYVKNISIPKTTKTGVVPVGRYMILEITDNGTGITDENMAKIFEPFFTTKEEGKGTGLGLSTVFGIMEEHDGYIDVESHLGMGSRFIIYWPVNEEIPVKPTYVESSEEVLKVDNKKILIVEDDEILVNLLQKALTNIGYNVVICSNGQEALNILKENTSTFDIVLTDLVMPVINGYELYEYIKQHHSELKIYLMTGYPDKTLEDKGITVPEGLVIHKPFQLNDLVKKLIN